MDVAASVARVVERFRVDDRVTVRHRLDDGSATDVVGWITAIDAERIEIVSPVDRRSTVPRDRIILARKVPPAMGGRPPAKVTAEELERAALPGWIGDSEPLGSWTLRSAGGFSGRANSCLAIGDPAMPYDRAAEAIIGYYTERGLEPRVQTVADSEVERRLGELGWQRTYVPTTVMVQPLSALLGTHPRNPRVEIDTELTEEWWQAFGRYRPIDDQRDAERIARRVVAGVPPVGLAAVRSPDSGRIVALGRGHVGEDWLGLSALWTDPDHRRTGLATMIMRELGHWAARLGARNTYLQVAKANTEAIAAYSQLGFTPHHDYVYLKPLA